MPAPPTVAHARPDAHGARLLAEYDDTMRRNAQVAGAHVEALPHLSRCTASSGSQRLILWHDFASVDAARHVDTELGAVSGHAGVLMWKLYAHDAAHDALRAALLARGFAENDPCTLMAATVETVLAALPSERTGELEARQLTRPAELDAYQAIWDDVWPDAANARYVSDYRHLVERREPGVAFFAGYAASGEAVTSGYLFHHAGDSFALLCGGATKVAWQRRHAYTLMLAVRARAAAARGARHLAVEASAESRPILARAGFRALSSLMFYEKAISAAPVLATTPR